MPNLPAIWSRVPAKPLYQAAERPEMETSPLPDLGLIKMKRYSTMTVQYSRGCPFNCEFL